MLILGHGNKVNSLTECRGKWFPKERYGAVTRSRGNRCWRGYNSNRLSRWPHTTRASSILLASAAGSGVAVGPKLDNEAQRLALGKSYSFSKTRKLSCSAFSAPTQDSAAPSWNPSHLVAVPFPCLPSSGCEMQGQRLVLTHCQLIIEKLAHGGYSVNSS